MGKPNEMRQQFTVAGISRIDIAEALMENGSLMEQEAETMVRKITDDQMRLIAKRVNRELMDWAIGSALYEIVALLCELEDIPTEVKLTPQEAKVWGVE
jgi:hypothetical protein